MKQLVCAGLWALISSSAFAGGYSGWAVPTVIEHSNGGILVYGDFNDVNDCSPGVNRPVFVAEDPNNPNFLPTVAPLLMMAVQAKSQVQFYLMDCTTVSWRQGQNAVFNRAWTSGVLFNSPTNAVGVAPDDFVTRLEALEAAVEAGANEGELTINTNVPSALNVWTSVGSDTMFSMTRLCANNGGQVVQVYIRKDAMSAEQYLEDARCWEYNMDTSTFMVPAGWQYKFMNYLPERLVSYSKS